MVDHVAAQVNARQPNPLITLSVTEMSRRLHAREVTSAALVEAHLERIQAVNPAINALVTDTFAAARQSAREADVALAGGRPLSPLHGIPFTLKDCHATKGVRSTCGLTARRDYIPAEDGWVAGKLRALGAILLGKTNLPENCWSQETNNLVFGRTNNPWALERTVGGSSGGSAALVAAGGTPFDIGSDIAGSIRLPAAFTGIVGLRPTSGTFPEEGGWPPATGRLAELEAIGPLTRRVEDAALLFDLLREEHPAPVEIAGLAGKKVASWADDGLLPASGEVVNGVERAVQALTSVGMTPVEGSPPARRLVGIGWCAYLKPADLRTISEGFGGGERWSPVEELWRRMRGNPRVSAEALLYWWSSNILSRPVSWLVNGERWRTALRSQLMALVGADGVAVSPIFPVAAPRHGWNLRDVPMASTLNYQMWVNLAGLPGLTVPVGFSAENLPLGVQLVGMPGQERTLLMAGLAIQQALMPEYHLPPL